MTTINEEIVIDTIVLAKNKFRGQSINLDSLCRRYNIDISKREVHGALKDAKLLALVYLELIGGKQTTLKFHNHSSYQNYQNADLSEDINNYYKDKKPIKKRNFNLNLNDYRLHLESLEKIPNKKWDVFKD
jgi:DNA polymerase-3 subunit epsilon